ncbi:epoxide hydrolase [Dothidotthia symphoricarpi CBS 119687]|uniref:Epoxide hydrolase n=1 Tax=Dothidotthia symphoricarpi CBS 119687 TaxID=1392245 RepID=A0A6A5ZZK4_9PLEO|nr:epoxide hydrolase [Dothidotthia symphoricarpi CBS 119687]KAF2124334.1 epoxide hydrolase [Dothidotthia symphoricarpi CBS 119687]
MPSVSPFQIAIPEERLQRLRQKLSLTDFPDEVNLDSEWERGCPLEKMQELVRYWLKEFDWRKQECLLNRMPQFTYAAEIDLFGRYNIHFVHQRSQTQKAIPLLFVHGWPGSFVEVSKILPLLTKSNQDKPSFHVVAPSLIDFGFSDASGKKGFGMDQHAEAYHKLMCSLGYHVYVVQGGDLGYAVARFIAWKYPESCAAHHTNMPAPSPPKNDIAELSADELQRMRLTQDWQNNEMAYAMLHATKPQTIGYSIADSPVGLLAWIYEKLHGWTDQYPWSKDEILTWVSIYYFSKPGPAATQRIYLENEQRTPKAFDQAASYVNVKLGISMFPKEILQLPSRWNRTLGPVVFERRHERGGHFAAWECPELLVADLREMCMKNSDIYEHIQTSSGATI